MADLFQFESPISELLVRATVLYFGILLFLRIMPRRTGGELAVMDLIFLLLITESAAHSLGDYTSLTEGLFLIAVICGLDFLVNMLSYRFRFVETLVSAPPIQVIKQGKLLRRNMRREYLTEVELTNHLRKEGIEDIAEVKAAFIESDGTISAITNGK